MTGKFYVGMHSTSDLEDEYIGSGKRLWNSINKHGKENHIKEIIEFLPDRFSLREREREIVNEKLLEDPLCMNLCFGGSGWPNNGTQIGGDKFRAAHKWWKNADRELTFLKTEHLRNESVVSKICETKMKRTGSKNGWKGRKHGTEYVKKMKEIMSNKQKGNKNSQFDTIWINDGRTSKKIRKNDSMPEGWNRGRHKLKGIRI